MPRIRQSSGDLNELGAHLADFLPAFPPAQSLPYLPDVARLEWLAHQAHYAADHAPLDVTALAGSREDDYARLALTLHPAVAVLAFRLIRCFASGKCIKTTIAAKSRSTWAAAVTMSSSTARSFARRSPDY